MINIIRAWGDSLKYLAPSSLKLWGLSILKGALETYKLLFKYIWIPLVALGVLRLAWHYQHYYPWLFQNRLVFPSSTPEVIFAYWFFLAMVVWFFWSFLAARPSASRKDLKYFAAYWAHGLAAFALALIMLVMLLVMSFVLWVIFENRYGLAAKFMWAGWFEYHTFVAVSLLLLGFDIFFVKPFLFTLFFLCDTQLSIYAIFKSVWNGIKLLWFMLPICILIHLVLCLVGVLIFMLVGLFCAYKGYIFLAGFFLLPAVYLNMFLYLYLKERYEHPERYS